MPPQILRIFEESIDVASELGEGMRNTLVTTLGRKFNQARQDRKYAEMQRLVGLANNKSLPEDEQTAAFLILLDGREGLKVINEPCDWSGSYEARTRFVEKWLVPVNAALKEKYGSDLKVRQAVVDKAKAPVEVRQRDRQEDTTFPLASPPGKGKGKGKGKRSQQVSS